jgi:hypothetical protein
MKAHQRVEVRRGRIKPDTPSAERIIDGLVRRVGCAYAASIPDDVARLIEKALAEALTWAKPLALWGASPLVQVEDKVVVGRGFRIESERWARLAGRIDATALMVVYAVTLGDDLDRRIASLQRESLSLAFVLDAAGSEILEQVADRFEADLQGRQELEGRQWTKRFSPGYCDWGLEGQEGLFSFLHPGAIGIHCTKAWSMVPSKSITAVLLGAKRTPFLTPCPLCDQMACLNRRECMLNDRTL